MSDNTPPPASPAPEKVYPPKPGTDTPETPASTAGKRRKLSAWVTSKEGKYAAGAVAVLAVVLIALRSRTSSGPMYAAGVRGEAAEPGEPGEARYAGSNDPGSDAWSPWGTSPGTAPSSMDREPLEKADQLGAEVVANFRRPLVPESVAVDAEPQSAAWTPPPASPVAAVTHTAAPIRASAVTVKAAAPTAAAAAVAGGFVPAGQKAAPVPVQKATPAEKKAGPTVKEMFGGGGGGKAAPAPAPAPKAAPAPAPAQPKPAASHPTPHVPAKPNPKPPAKKR